MEESAARLSVSHCGYRERRPEREDGTKSPAPFQSSTKTTGEGDPPKNTCEPQEQQSDID
ncbi:hypothetical protein EYF80_058515 [Liparis tanakae]|uniref:Uncharacterized protein n=1 Tax=Liparis tanakae TaxID=230148 RepID=A0A4Z2ERD6_9TELE|nr:hypothetical protein EYF80_058515 [Liparis tanakae]